MKNKKTKFMIIGILLVVITLIVLFSTTYALFANDSYAANPNNYSTGILSIIAKSKTENISLTNVLPMTDEEGKQGTPYVFTIENVGNLDYKFDVKLLSTGDDNTIFSPEYIKLQIDEGEVTTLKALSNSKIKSDITLLAGESIDISIRIWLSIDTPNTELGKSFNSKIVTDGQAIYTENNNNINLFADYITNLYIEANKTKKTNNSVTYNFATSVGLMNDKLGGALSYDGGNVRYYGADPNNYVYFNCDDYNNQSSETCEVWRIVGVFDGKVKLMRASTIGNYSYDNKSSGIGSSTSDYGSNEWYDSRLMMVLNPGYDGYSTTNPLKDESGDTVYGYEGSLWWNGKNGTCYSGNSNATVSCDFTSDSSTSGLKNDETRNMISTTTWYMNAMSSGSYYPNTLYKNERKSTDTWIGEVAIPYTSDYLYASDISKCRVGYYYSDTACLNTNWMYNIITNNGSVRGRLYTKSSKGTSKAYGLAFIYNSSNVGGIDHSASARSAYGIVPVIYLEENITLLTGNGTSSSPYKIKVNYEKISDRYNKE